MPPKIKCAHGCGRDAGTRCVNNMAPLCGTCCDCPEHDRRTRRRGAKSGHRSKRCRTVRGIEQNLQWSLNAAVSWVEQESETSWRSVSCFTWSSKRRFLLRFVQAEMKLYVRGEHNFIQAPFLENVPAHMLERVTGMLAMRFPLDQVPEVVSPHSSDDEDGPEPDPCVQKEPTVPPPAEPSAPEPETKEPIASLPPIFSLWPETSMRSASSSSTSTALHSVPAVSAPVITATMRWLSEPSSARSMPAEPRPSAHTERLPAATYEDYERGLFRGVTRASQYGTLPWPWRDSVRESFRPVDHGYWPWNAVRGRTTAFRNRIQGPHPSTMSVQRGKWSSLEEFLSAGGLLGLNPPVRVDEEVRAICEWIAARPAMAALVTRMEIVPTPADGLPEGTWIRANLRRPAGHPLASQFSCKGYHGTSMSNLARTVVHGLQSGWSAINEGQSNAITGIYIMGQDAMDLCSTYMLYSPLQRTGYYWGPILEVCYYQHPHEQRKHVAKKAGRATQYVTYSDVSTIGAILFHVVSAADLVEGSKDVWMNVEPEMATTMEISTTEPWEVVQQRSAEKWEQARREGISGPARDD